MSSKIRGWVTKIMRLEGAPVVHLKLTCRNCGQKGSIYMTKQALRDLLELLETNP